MKRIKLKAPQPFILQFDNAGPSLIVWLISVDQYQAMIRISEEEKGVDSLRHQAEAMLCDPRKPRAERKARVKEVSAFLDSLSPKGLLEVVELIRREAISGSTAALIEHAGDVSRLKAEAAKPAEPGDLVAAIEANIHTLCTLNNRLPQEIRAMPFWDFAALMKCYREANDKIHQMAEEAAKAAR